MQSVRRENVGTEATPGEPGESSSGQPGVGRWRTAVADRLPAPDPHRLLATAGVGLVVAAYVRVLHGLALVAGDPTALLAVVGAALVAGTLFARYPSRWLVVVAAGVALVGGGYAYFQSLPPEWTPAAIAVSSVGTVLAFATGRSVLEVVNAGFWVLVATPVPTFLAWYLAVRGAFVRATVVAGSVLGLLVLTGDAGVATTTLGVVGGLAAVGFGDIAVGDAAGVDRARRTLLMELGGVVAVAQVLSVVPDGEGEPVTVLGGPADDTLEANLTRAGDEVTVSGDLSLSAAVRFVVTADERAYWRVGAYDRYTGRGWERTGEDRAYAGRLPAPEGESEDLEQQVRVESDLSVLPAAWKPRSVTGVDGVRVGDSDGLTPEASLSSGDTYAVRSSLPAASPATLRAAGGEYPERVRERYTQVPGDTPDRVRQRARQVTATVSAPYDAARAIEAWLEAEKEYSLDVDRPEGDIADAFMFEMEAGYCTYYATAMATMLRALDIPARFVVGYTPGQRVGDRWVVRGFDAHAWVEVYIRGQGWVRFDPTPAGPRRRAERERLAIAREQGDAEVDAAGSAGEPLPELATPAPTPTPAGTNGSESGGTSTPDVNPPEFDDGGSATEAPSGEVGIDAGDGPAGTVTDPGLTFEGLPGQGADGGSDSGSQRGLGLPSPEQVGLGAVLLAGLGAGAQSAGVTERAWRTVWLRVQPRVDPETDVERAYERLEYVLSRRRGPRRTGETASQYLDRVGDERARRVGQLYAQARYGEGVDEAAADEAVALVREVVRDG
ncbi:MAG: transglutaminaseTgpA domain-containing protein [Haloarculaceae archaeon]